MTLLDQDFEGEQHLVCDLFFIVPKVVLLEILILVVFLRSAVIQDACLALQSNPVVPTKAVALVGVVFIVKWSLVVHLISNRLLPYAHEI